MAEKLEIIGKIAIDSSDAQKSISDITKLLSEAKKIQSQLIDQFGEASPQAKAAAESIALIEKNLIQAKNSANDFNVSIEQTGQDISALSAPISELKKDIDSISDINIEANIDQPKIDIPEVDAIVIPTNVEQPEVIVPDVSPIEIDTNVNQPIVEIPLVEPIDIPVNVEDVKIDIPSVEPVIIDTQVNQPDIIVPDVPTIEIDTEVTQPIIDIPVIEPIKVETEIEPIEVPKVEPIKIQTEVDQPEIDIPKVEPIKLTIDNKELKKNLQDSKNELSKMITLFGEGSNEAKEAALAVEELNNKINEAGDNSEKLNAPIKSLSAQLGEAEDELRLIVQQFGLGSKEAGAAAKKVGELTNTIEDAKKLSDTFNPNTKFLALGNAVQGAAGGFAALQGAQALFGSESKKLEETLVKVQSAMALSQGINSVIQSKDAFIALGTSAKAALSGIRTGIAATGIGVLLVALGAIVAYWDDIKTAVGGVSGEQRKQAENAKKAVEAEQKKLDAIDNQSNILKLQGKSERDILNLKLKQYDQVITAAQAQIKIDEDNRKREQAATERNAKLLKSYLDFVSLPLNYLFKTFASIANNAIDLINKIPGVNIDFKVNDKLVEEGTAYLTKAIFDPEETKKEGDKAAKEANDALTKLQNDRAGVILQMQEMDKAAAEKAKQERDKNNKILLETQKMHQEAMLALLSDGYVKERQLINIQYQDQLKALDDLVASKELTEAQAAERRKAITEKYNADILNLEKQNSEKRQTFLISINQQTEKAIQDARLIAIEDGFTKQQILLEQKYQEQIDAVIKQNDELNNQYNKDKENLDILLQSKAISQDEYNKQVNTLNQNLLTDEAALNQLRLANDKVYQAERDKLIQENNKKTELDNFNKATKDLEDQINADNLLFESKRQALDNEQKLLEDARAKGIITEEQYTERNKKLADTRKAIGKAEVESRKAQLQAVTGLLNGFADLVGKQTKAGKAAAIAGLIIDQGQRVAEIITSTQAAVAKDIAASPLTGGMPWVALHVAQGALGVATSVKAVKKGISDIKSAGEGGGEGGGGGSASPADVGTAPAPVPPLPPVPETTALPQEQINQLVGANAAVKAYVVESDVTNGQERITRLNRAARIS